jgi:hypothetical protein
MPLTWGFFVERVTGIEPALSAWEQTCHSHPAQSGVSRAHHRGRFTAAYPHCPSSSVRAGTKRARAQWGMSLSGRPSALVPINGCLLVANEREESLT